MTGSQSCIVFFLPFARIAVEFQLLLIEFRQNSRLFRKNTGQVNSGIPIAPGKGSFQGYGSIKIWNGWQSFR